MCMLTALGLASSGVMAFTPAGPAVNLVVRIPPETMGSSIQTLNRTG